MTLSEGLPLLQDPVSPRTKAREAQQYRRRQMRRRVVMGAVLATLLVATGYLAVSRYNSTPIPATLETASPFADVVDAYRQTHDFDGVVQVRINGSVVYQAASGLADEEFDVPMKTDSIFPIGSNSKLFVAVALYQLQERGVVNLTDAVNLHLNQSDFAAFGYPNQTEWCPRVDGAAPDSPCENVTFVQLLHMGSGIGDSANCDNVKPEYCHATADNLFYYKGSLAPYVGVFINDPLVFKPGTNYSYANPNYNLLSYLVEKLSGMPFDTYIKTKIADPIGLHDTYFDPYSGGLGVRHGYVQQYIHYYVQASPDTPAERLSTGTCSPYINSGAISGAGGIRSTVSDMQRWYLDLFDNRGTTSKVLRPESIRMILERVNPVNPMYGQGIGVGPAGADGWPSQLSYCGGMKCCITCLAMAFPEHKSDSSVLIGAFSSHMHYTFTDRAAFANFHLNGLSIEPPTGVRVDDGGAVFLPSALAKAYNTNYTSA